MGHKINHSDSTFNIQSDDNVDRNVIALFDPRFRIICALLFAIVIVTFYTFTPLLIALGLAVVMMLLAKLPVKSTLKKIIMMDTFVIFLIFMLPFTTEGDVVFNLFGFDLTQQGFEKAGLIALKTNAIVMMLLAMVGTIAPQTLGVALRHLYVPQNLVHLILFSVRYIDVLRLEYKRMRNSMKTRCFRPRNTLHTYRSIGYLVGMLIIRSLERSERILQAMKCRGFCGKFYITEQLIAARKDYIATLLFVSFCLVLLLMENGYVRAY